MGLEGWQHFMGPAMCFMEQVFMGEEPGWQAEQGERATRTPRARINRVVNVKNFFMFESYTLFPGRAKGALLDRFILGMVITKRYDGGQGKPQFSKAFIWPSSRLVFLFGEVFQQIQIAFGQSHFLGVGPFLDLAFPLMGGDAVGMGFRVNHLPGPEYIGSTSA